MLIRPLTLLVDIGNSRIKYAYLDNVGNLSQIWVVDDIESLYAMANEVFSIYLASVGQVEKTQSLIDWCSRYNRAVIRVQTQTEALGIKNAYENFQHLGVDRWLGIIAARQHTQLPCAV